MLLENIISHLVTKLNFVLGKRWLSFLYCFIERKRTEVALISMTTYRATVDEVELIRMP